MVVLENEKIIVRIKELGAELCGIFLKETQSEYMWQPGLEIWDHSSLTLFPNNGRIFRDRTIINGKTYPATMQGFAKGQLFNVISKSSDSAVLELLPNEYTKQFFPYDYSFRILYRITGNKLSETFCVENKGNEPMYFCLGSHPGFYLPLELGEKAEDYVIRFDRKQNISRLVNEPVTMLLTGERKPYLTDGTDIELYDSIFNGGSHLLEGVDASTVTLLSRKSGKYVEIGIENFPYMCLWGNPIRPFLVCIEPWCGTSDFIDTDHIWEKRPGALRANAYETIERELTFSVG